jgi:hypothetical protein
MRKEYDFSRSRKNPYAKQLKRQITIRLDTAAVEYFKRPTSVCRIRTPSLEWQETAPKQTVRR